MWKRHAQDVETHAIPHPFSHRLSAAKSTPSASDGTTHDMDDVEALCPRMLIVDHGRKLYDGAVAGIRERFGGDRTLIADLDSNELARLPRDASGQPALDDLPVGVRQVPAESPRVALAFGRDTLAAHELVAWLGARYRLRDVTFVEPEIEDVIRRIYENKLLLTEVEATTGRAS